jgi:hypothetical protein
MQQQQQFFQQQQSQQQHSQQAAVRESERLEPCLQYLTESVHAAFRWGEPRLARVLVASARSLTSVRLNAAAMQQPFSNEAAVARQLYQKWTQLFVVGYQASSFLADPLWWAAAGDKKAAKSAAAAGATVGGGPAVFEPVLRLLRDLYSGSAKLVRSLVDCGESLTLTLRLLRPGLISPNVDVASWTCRLLSRLAFDLDNERMREVAWRWLSGIGAGPNEFDMPSAASSASAAITSDGTGLQAALVCFHRHPDIRLALFPVLDQFSRAHWSLLFGSVLPSVRLHHALHFIEFSLISQIFIFNSSYSDS